MPDPASDLPTSTRTACSKVATILPVIPLMSKEEGERLISQMPQRSLEMIETVLGRRMPLVEGGMQK